MDLLIILAIVYFVASNFISRTKREAQQREQRQDESALADSMEIIRKGNTRSETQQIFTSREPAPVSSNRPARRNVNKQRGRLEIREREDKLRRNRSEQLKSSLEHQLEDKSLSSRGGYTHTYDSVFDDEDDWDSMLSELNEFYHDSDLEEDSWMNDSQLNILPKVENIQHSSRRRQNSNNIAQLFKNPQTVKQGIIFSEIINGPKAKQKRR